jgi:hypothetical protein
LIAAWEISVFFPPSSSAEEGLPRAVPAVRAISASVVAVFQKVRGNLMVRFIAKFLLLSEFPGWRALGGRKYAWLAWI